MRRILALSWEVVKMIVISMAIIIPVRYFLVQPFYVKGASMEPNFHDHEYLMVDEISYRFSEPDRGDIVVFRNPGNPQEFYIKRVIGLPGETIQIKDGKINIYNPERPEGFELSESYLTPGLKTYSSTEDKIRISDNEYYLLGDNRLSSRDSRKFGTVNDSFIIGKVFFRGWPFDRLGLIEATEYNY